MLTWLSLLKMGGPEKEGNRYDVPDFYGSAGGSPDPLPTFIAAFVLVIASVL